MTELRDRVWQALSEVQDPELRRPLTELGMVSEIDVDDAGCVHVEVLLTIVGCPAASRIEADVRAALDRACGDTEYTLRIGVMTPQQRKDLTTKLRGKRDTHPFGPDSLTRIIAVTSGKGGVGKSTVTVNLAVSLAASGLRVGVVDADVYGFSVPGLLGLPPEAQPTQVGELMLPPIAHDVKAVSIGMFLRNPGEVVAWRGPMLHRTLEQFLRDVFFGDLDVLLIDLPPGTGDIAISLAQLLPRSEVLVVTTPQPAAAEVAWRSGALAEKTGQRVIGVIETLSPTVLADGSEFALFGSGGGEQVANKLGVPLIANVPVSEPLRAAGDSGEPIVLSHPDDPAARALQQAADTIRVRPQGLAGRRLPVQFD